MSQIKRINVNLGQQLEVEYRVTPPEGDFAAGIAVERVSAYNHHGGAHVDVTPLVREHAADLLEKITNRCLEAEGLGPDIPF